MCLLQNIYRNHVSQWFVPVCVCGSEVAQCCVCVLLPVSEVLLNVHSSDVLDMPVDPNEPTYCLCAQVSYGEMIGCDNADVYTHTHTLSTHSAHYTYTVCTHCTHTVYLHFTHTLYLLHTLHILYTCIIHTFRFFYTLPPTHFIHALHSLHTTHFTHTGSQCTEPVHPHPLSLD